jgi:O-antigen/teichoic acid export membrane protein
MFGQDGSGRGSASPLQINNLHATRGGIVTAGSTLKRQVISGVSWVALANVAGQLLQFIIMLVLARLLTPNQFGLVAMIAVFIGFAQLFSELGFGVALVQRKVVEERHLSSIFWLNLVTGICLTGIMALSSPLIANFYHEPMLIPLTMVIALNFTIGAFNDVQTAILRRGMQFRRVVLIETLSIGTAGVVAILMAAAGWGVWALVAQTLAQTAVEVVVMWFTTSWKPKFLFDMEAIRELMRFSLNLLGSNIFAYWIRNADNLLVGRFVDATSLGLYAKTYSLMLLPITQVTRVLSSVMFSALSRIQDEPERIKAIMLRTHRVIGLITIPMMAGLLVVAEPFVLTLFNPRWAGMIPILQILCLVAIKQPLGSTMGWIFQSQGRTDLQLKWTAINGVITIISFLIGIRWGVIGVAWAYAIRSYIVWYPSISVPGHLIGMTFGEFMRNVADIFVLSGVMAAGVFGIGLILPEGWPHWLTLVAQVTAGVVIFGGLVVGLKIQAYRDLVGLVRERRNPTLNPSP